MLIGRPNIHLEEAISNGKFCLWMTVFSTCLFVSCGETSRQPPKPKPALPNAQVVPIHSLEEVGSSEPILDRDPSEEFSPLEDDWGEFNEDLEQFEEEYDQDLDEIRHDESGKETEEDFDQPFPPVEHPETPADGALTPPTHQNETIEGTALSETAPSPPKDSQRLEDREAAWEALFQASEDSDSFEEDSPDEFEYVD